MKTLYAIAIAAVAMMATPVMAETIYLDKMDKVLDDWWNALDFVCRVEPGEESDLACEQRSALDKILEKKGCRNIYPATGPDDTSNWKCRKVK